MDRAAGPENTNALHRLDLLFNTFQNIPFTHGCLLSWGLGWMAGDAARTRTEEKEEEGEAGSETRSRLSPSRPLHLPPTAPPCLQSPGVV